MEGRLGHAPRFISARHPPRRPRVGRSWRLMLFAAYYDGALPEKLSRTCRFFNSEMPGGANSGERAARFAGEDAERLVDAGAAGGARAVAQRPPGHDGVGAERRFS